jgi:HlyD family secretion protein
MLENEASVNISPFRPGMSAKVDILTRRAEDVISIPIQSVSTREKENDEEESELGVFILVDGIAEWKVVETGIQDNRYIEIKSGLNESDKVVIGPYQAVSRTLSNGDAVEVQEDSENDDE